MTTLLSAALLVAVLVPLAPASMAAGSDASVTFGTFTVSRPATSCLVSGAGTTTATFVSGIFTSLDASTFDGGLLLSAAAGPGAVEVSSAWCGPGVAPGVVTNVSSNCVGATLSFTFTSTTLTVTFTSTSDGCLGIGGTPVSIAPRSNPQEVYLGDPDFANPTFLGCFGFVFVTFSTNTAITLPTFGATCSEMDLCTPYSLDPLVDDCVINPILAPQGVFVAGVRHVVTACLWEQPINVDYNVDGTPDLVVPTKTLDLHAC